MDSFEIQFCFYIEWPDIILKINPIIYCFLFFVIATVTVLLL